jgi:hypothetical protein
MQSDEHASLADVVATLTHLHRVKDRIYQDAWRRRGELIGIFANIARKYDRLENAQRERDPDSVETRTDTAADLAIYAGKYLSWLIEHHPALAASFDADPSAWSAARGHDALAAILVDLASAERQRKLGPPRDLGVAFAAVAEPFAQLEAHLVDATPLRSADKAELVWALTDSATRYVWRLAQDDRAAWGRFAAEVATLA